MLLEVRLFGFGVIGHYVLLRGDFLACRCGKASVLVGCDASLGVACRRVATLMLPFPHGMELGVVALLSETRGSQPVVGRGSGRGSRTDPMGSSGNPFVCKAVLEMRV